jgi:hypothetical protein
MQGISYNSVTITKAKFMEALSSVILPIFTVLPRIAWQKNTF